MLLFLGCGTSFDPAFLIFSVLPIKAAFVNSQMSVKGPEN